MCIYIYTANKQPLCPVFNCNGIVYKNHDICIWDWFLDPNHSFFLSTGHHPAAPVLPAHSVTDWEVHTLPRALRPPPLRGAYVSFRRQDQQWKHDKVPPKSEGNVWGPEDSSDLLPPGGRVPPVQRASETQRWWHPTVSPWTHTDI